MVFAPKTKLASPSLFYKQNKHSTRFKQSTHIGFSKRSLTSTVLLGDAIVTANAPHVKQKGLLSLG
jgi:hypothetical protein